MKTMKKALWILALLSLAMILASCNLGGEHEHIPGTAVTENKVKATCTTKGSYDKVIYCADCGEELSRETVNEGYDEDGHQFTQVHNDLSTCGICGGYIDYQCCSLCGITEDVNSQIDCDYDFVTTEDGFKIVCTVCGTELKNDTATSEKDEICRVYTTTSSIFLKDGKEVAKISTKEVEYQHDDTVTYEKLGETCEDGYRRFATCKDCGRKEETEKEVHETETIILDLAEKGMCGGKIYYDICQVCGEVTEYNTYLDECDWDFQGLDSDGYQVCVCNDCGAIWKDKTIEEDPVNCIVNSSHSTKITINDVVIFDKTANYVGEDHNYDVTYKLNGETCEDGWTVTYVCSDCKKTYTEEGSDHVYEEAYTYFGDYDMCGGSLMVDYCPVCGDLYCQGDSSPIHHYSLCDYELVETTSDGFEKSVCSDCGAVLYYKKTVSSKDAHCNATVFESIRIEKDSEVIAKAEGTYVLADHEYEYAYTLNGTTCDEGYRAVITCKNCDYTAEYESTFHSTESVEVNFADYGMCGGSGTMDVCQICGKTTNYDCSPYWSECEWGEMEITSDGYEKRVCSVCGAVWQYKDTEGEKDENCIAKGQEEILITMGTTVVFHATCDYLSQFHNYGDPVYVKNGATCADGWTATYTCKDCGEVYIREDEGHVDVDTGIDFEELGLCGGYGTITVCAICGEKTGYFCYPESFDCEWGEPETTTDGFEKRVCSECGAIWLEKDTDGEKDEECVCPHTKHTILKLNGNTVFDEEMTYTSIDHAFTETYETYGECETDGWEVTYTCDDCGYTYTDTGSYHQYQWETVCEENETSCGITVEVYRCHFCKEMYDADWAVDVTTDCNFGDAQTTEDGYKKYVCSECGAVKYEKVTESQPDADGNVTCTHTLKIQLGGSTLYEITRTYTKQEEE